MLFMLLCGQTTGDEGSRVSEGRAPLGAWGWLGGGSKDARATVIKNSLFHAKVHDSGLLNKSRQVGWGTDRHTYGLRIRVGDVEVAPPPLRGRSGRLAGGGGGSRKKKEEEKEGRNELLDVLEAEPPPPERRDSPPCTRSRNSNHITHGNHGDYPSEMQAETVGKGETLALFHSRH